MTRIAPYGSWSSPITAEIAAGAAISFSGVLLEQGDLYWLENRPAEGGRCTVMRRSAGGRVSEQTPADFNVRSKVHEYGGGEFAVHDGLIFFVNLTDQRIYRQEPGREAVPIAPAGPRRHADLVVDRSRQRLLCIQEDHGKAGEPQNSIVAVSMDGSQYRVLVSGNDFYSNARLSPDGSRLAYLTWNHPNMPWDGCELWLAEVQGDGTVRRGQRIAGGLSESIFQPEWSPAGVLHFVSDSTGWWNLHQWTAGATRPLCPMPAEFGRAMWAFGASTYGFAAENRILCCFSERGVDHLAWLGTDSGELESIETPYTKIELLRCNSDQAAFIGAAPALPSTVVLLDLRSRRLQSVRSAFKVALDGAYIAPAVALEWTSVDGSAVHGLYYAPTNPKHAPPEGERPPLIVQCHGGPTSAASSALSYPLQFWTSRGCAVLEVNYGGSTGYGREYRHRLYGQWGVVDVEDCCSGALFLARQGHVDRARMVIRGGSAGGYTALACLVFRNDVFALGAVRYGIADLELLAGHSHKFESRYLQSLIGPFPAGREVYRARSPIQHAEDLRAGLILLQGDDDPVVPPAQSQLMYDVVRNQGLPTALLRFAGEGHGFRRAETLKRALEAELDFVARVFHFAPNDDLEPISIENLPAGG